MGKTMRTIWICALVFYLTTAFADSCFSPVAVSDQEQSQGQNQRIGGPNGVGSDCCVNGLVCCGTPGSVDTALAFDCILQATGSSCVTSYKGGALYDVHTVCVATALTPAVDRLDPSQVSGFEVDPIQSASGPHECSIQLELGGALVAGPVKITFGS